MGPALITEAAVRQHCTAQSFKRGREYYCNGAVESLVRVGDALHAELEGSEAIPYRVTITLGPAGVEDVLCSCMDAYAGWCKHIVAVLLAYIKAPQDVAAGPPVGELVAQLDADQLKAVVLKLAERHPDLADEIASQTTRVSTASDPAGTCSDPQDRIPALDPALAGSPDLDSYRKARNLAADSWPAVRAELLQHLRTARMHDCRGSVDIFLFEGLIDDALDSVKHSHDDDLIGRVVDAAIHSRPVRVIPICRQQAEEIMGQGRAIAYDDAVRWLRRMRDAHRVIGADNEWTSYLQGVLEQHRKKYKLVPMLKALSR